MRPLKSLAEPALAALAGLLGLLLGVPGSMEKTEPPPNLTKAAMGGTPDPDAGSDPIGKRLLEAIPDGGTLTYDEFVKAAGQDISSVVGWANPKKVTRNGNHLVIEGDGGSITQSAFSVTAETRVECDVSVSGDTVTFTRVRGVKVALGGAIKLMRVESVTITKNADGTFSVKGKAEISRFLPYIPFSLTIDPNSL